MKVFSKNINGVDIVAQINGVDVEGSDWSLTTKFMAEDRMTLTTSIPVDQDSDTKIKFGKDWYVKDEYGNIYTLVSAQPTSSKKSKSLETSYSLVFGGADIYLSKRTYREKATLGELQLSYSSTVAFVGNIDDFLDRLKLNLDTAFGKTILVGSEYECKYKIVRSYGDISFSQSDYKSVSFSNLSIWEVLLKTNEIFGYEWLSYTDANTGQIVFEFNTTVGETLDHTFTYRGDRNYDLSTKESLDGIQGGITDLTVTDKMSEVKTRITGTGGTTNIPLNHYILSDYNYLRDYEVAERPTYLRNLMPRVYRCYVMGFNDQRYYLAKDPNSDDVINDNEAYPKVMDLENRFSYHDAADDIASGDITIDTFEAWHLNYKNVWNKPTATDAAQYSRLNLDDDWYALDDKDTPDWDDLTTPPYGFKAYLKGWNDRAKAFEVIDEDSNVVPEAFFDPISYVDSIHQADYGIIEHVNEADESIYPALGDDVNDIIDAEIVEPDGKVVVFPSSVFPQAIDEVDMISTFPTSISYTNVVLLDLWGFRLFAKDYFEEKKYTNNIGR